MSAREELLAVAGECAECHEYAAERMTVAIVQGNSGPGWSRYACVPCARRCARSVFAPAWLREDLAALDGEGARCPEPGEPGELG